MVGFRLFIWFTQLSMIFLQGASFGVNMMTVGHTDGLVVQCTYNLIKKYFRSGESLSGSVLVVSLTLAAPVLQTHMIEAFHMDPDLSWSLVVRYPRQPSASKVKDESSLVQEKPQTYFVVLENLDDEDMDDVFEDWKLRTNWNPLAQFVVYFSTTEETEEEISELMVEILLMFMTRKIFNINVIAQTEESGHIYSKTVFPYEPENNCGSRVIAFQTLDICDIDEDDEEGGIYVEELSRGLFLDKIPKDLGGCSLTAYSRTWEPYIFVQDAQMKGIEWMLVQTLAESLHIGIEILIQNRTLFHILQGLIDGEIDIVIGGIDEDPNLSHLVSSSVPYLQDDLTWCVTRAKKVFNWLNFLRVFSEDTYITYIGFILLNVLVIYMIQIQPSTKQKLSKDIVGIMMVVVGFALNQPGRSAHLQSSIRICVLMSLITALLLGSVYNSFLISSLTNPLSLPQVKTAEQLMEYKMAVTGSVEIIRHLNKEGDIFRYIRREFSMCYNIEECLQKAAYNQQLAVAVSRQYSLHNPRIPRDNLYCFDRDENIYTYLVTMLMPNKFHLFHQINPIIQYIIESGHLLKWTREVELERVLKAAQNTDDKRIQTLNLNQISGAFLLTGIIFSFACAAFVMEMVVHRLHKRGTKVIFVNRLHNYFAELK